MIIKRIFFNKKSVISSILFFIKDVFYYSFYKRFKIKSPIIFYPFEKYLASNRYRGLIALTIKDNIELSCNSCELCLSVCPTDCLYIDTNENLKKEQKSPVDFKIDILKCVYCGLCEDICPVDAIRLTSELPPVLKSKEDALWGIDQLAFRKKLNNGKGIRGLFS